MSTVVFDIGRVIVPEGDRIQRLAQYLEEHGVSVSPPSLARGYWEHRDRYDLALPAAEYWPLVFQTAGLDAESVRDVDIPELAALDGERNATASPETEALLRDTQAAGYRVALMSNAPTPMVSAVRSSAWGRDIEVRVFSSEVGVSKPSPKIYALTEEKLAERYPDYDRAETVFFDDREDNVAAASEFGWQAYVWEGADEARALLKL